MIDSLLIAVHAFASRVMMSFSVDEKVNLSTSFKGPKSEFESHWVPHSIGLVPHRSKELRNLQLVSKAHPLVWRCCLFDKSTCIQTCLR